MPGSDPGHWLHRLDAAEWLAAAATELAHAEEKLSRRSFRPGVTHARRAAGMAWNAVLVTAPDERYGRSYMEHVVMLANSSVDDAADSRRTFAPPPVCCATRPDQPIGLIEIGKPDLSVLEAAKTIVEFARARVTTK